jgi:excinuclease ABC subunit C
MDPTVDALFSFRAFENFGPSRFGPLVASNTHRIRAAGPAQLRRLVRHDCPRVPGVYGMLNHREELIYVGKAKCLRTRLLSYFRVRSRDPKAGRILSHTRGILWEIGSSEFAALLRELELIHRWRPRLNVFGQPARRRLTYVCLGRSPAAYIFLSGTPASRSKCYGPVRAGWRTREAVRHLNDSFKLRDCPNKQTMVFAGQRELFPILHAPGCLRYEIGTCLGPCIGACSKDEYRRSENAAWAFLEGRNATLLTSLEQHMRAASGRLEFERAASLRNKLELLKWLDERLGKIRAARNKPPFVYCVPGHDGSQMWYLVQYGEVVAAIAPPQSPSQKRTLARTLESLLAGRAISVSRRRPFDMDLVYLVAAWFRRYPEEKGRILSLYRALAHCRSVPSNSS